jgi:hypothetical protein
MCHKWESIKYIDTYKTLNELLKQGQRTNMQIKKEGNKKEGKKEINNRVTEGKLKLCTVQ